MSSNRRLIPILIPVSVVAGLEQSWKLCYVLCSKQGEISDTSRGHELSVLTKARRTRGWKGSGSRGDSRRQISPGQPWQSAKAAIVKEAVNLNRAGGAEEDVEGYGLVASYC